MNQRVLLPTDFSKNALNAIRYALDMYKNQQCDFYLLNVFQVDGYSLDNMMVPEPGNKAYDAARKHSEEGFQKLLDILELHIGNPKHTYHTISTYNLLIDAINDTVAKKDIDIVVMGTKGATGSKGVIFGTNTVAAMEAVTGCPVLSVPQDFRFSPPVEIVFPTDYKTNFKRRELNHLLDISKMHGTPIRVLHIMEESKLSKTQEANKELLETIFENVECSFHTLEDTKVHKGIGIFIESRGSDMIAFLNKKHSFLGIMFTKPLVKEIGYHARIPVLVLNDYSK
ncbi:universal stress protein [Sediminicola sp. 1XM1-17]|uniref:universal stress protein n=1 Tax=Sediminicola sp. 1XM1-17 TaxID=3127702 RepID=UPI0030775A40